MYLIWNSTKACKVVHCMHRKNIFKFSGNILVLDTKLQNVRDKVVHFYAQDELFEINITIQSHR